MSQRFYLMASNWIADAPAGHRLRWTFPFRQTLEITDRFVGWPEGFIVERAPVPDKSDWPTQNTPFADRAGRIWDPGALGVPRAWWSAPRDIALGTVLQQNVALAGGAAVQAVTFRFEGARRQSARIVGRRKGVTDPLAPQTVPHGERVLLVTRAMDSIEIETTAAGRLLEFQTLDLFAERPLAWESVAQVMAGATRGASYGQLTTRAPFERLPFDHANWALLADAIERFPSTAAQEREQIDVGGTLSTIGQLELALASSWETCVALGFGFVDGSSAPLSALDRVDREGLLAVPPADAVAYRIRGVGGVRDWVSNVQVCRGVESPLSPPATLAAERRIVRLVDGRGTASKSNKDGAPLEASYNLQWGIRDMRAVGLRVEERHIDGSGAAADTFHVYPPGAGFPITSASHPRTVSVPDPAIRMEWSAASVDAFGRISAPVSTPAAAFTLDHAPSPPPLRAGELKPSGVDLYRDLRSRWAPDWLVRRLDGVVVVLQEVRKPAMWNGTMDDPRAVRPGVFSANLNPAPAKPEDFVGGTLTSAGAVVTVSRVSGAAVEYSLESGESGMATPAAGDASLQQALSADALWREVARFPAHALPETLSIRVPVESQPLYSVLSFATRLEFGGIRGPLGAPVQVIVPPQTIPRPPAFVAESLGRDFYGRLNVLLTLRIATAGLFRIWWMFGTPSGEAAFQSEAKPAPTPARPAIDGRLLVDTLEVPAGKGVPLVIGLRRETAEGGCGGFEIVSLNT